MRRHPAFLEALQMKTARATITSSSMRGPGCGEAIRAGRAFVCGLELRRFSSRTRAGFQTELDDATRELVAAMPRVARSWGLARKGINIFLRECLYTSYLRDYSRIERAERYFELPLDSLTGKALKRTAPELPRWDCIRRLTPTISEAFQAAASREGDRRGFARVHLDVFWWGRRGRDA
jgi:hypothetical protein